MDDLKAGANLDTNNRSVWVVLTLILIFLFATAVLSYCSAGRHADSSVKTERSLNVLMQLERLSSDLKDAETGQRGYLLTGKNSYLAPYQAAQVSITKDLQRFGTLADNDSFTQSQIKRLSTLVNSKLDELGHTVELQTHNDHAGALRIVNSDAGKKLMDEIRTILSEMTAHTNKILSQQNAEGKSTAVQTAWFTGALTFCIATSLLLMMYLISHQAAKRRAAEQAVSRSEKNFKMLVSSVLDYAIIALDTDGNIVSWNEGAKRLKGYAEDEIIGKHFSSFYLKEDVDAGKPDFQLKEAARVGRFEDFGWRVRKDGSQFYANVIMTATKDAYGNLRGFSKVTRDITERKVDEDRLMQSKQELELLNGELAHARDQAQAASKFKSEFVANMSHEIRTPMNGIIGMCNILLKTRLDESQEQYARAIKTAANGLLTVINDILDFSKIEAGRIELELHEFNLVNMVEGVCEILAIQARSKKLSLLCYVDPELPQTLRGDSERLRQILLNLTSNAIKFSTTGEIVVKAEMETRQGNVANVLFSVSDFGIGLSKSEQKKLFQPFVQADGSISRKFGGTGLGLSISKSLVELMNGTIGVDSTKGQGSTFWFKVGLEIRKVVQTSPHKALHGVRVLIVDDEPNAREILDKYIVSWGMRNGTAGSAQEAIERLKEGFANNDPYQVAIVDLVLPGKSGIELAREIFLDSGLRGTNLILLTAFDTPGLGPQAIDLGFKAYVTKPVRQSQLLDCLTDVICCDQLIDSQRPLENSGSSSSESDEEIRHELILVAEDHPINQKVAQLYLDELGFAVHIVDNGKEAVKAISTRKYDLVFMDCQMPEMDGLLATKIIRKREARTGFHIPIIAMTAHAMKEDQDKCFAAGMDDFLSKPVDPARLREMIRKWLPLKVKAAETFLAGGSLAEPESSEILPIDPRSLKDKFGEFAQEIIKIFFDDTPSQIAIMYKAVEDNHVQTLEKTAHKLKGVCAALGATKMEGSCLSVEKDARNNDFQSAQNHLAQLESDFTAVKEVLNHFGLNGGTA